MWKPGKRYLVCKSFPKTRGRPKEVKVLEVSSSREYVKFQNSSDIEYWEKADCYEMLEELGDAFVPLKYTPCCCSCRECNCRKHLPKIEWGNTWGSTG